MSTVLQDFRFSYKLFKAAPGIALLAVISLALAIAASTTIFSVIYTVLLAAPIFKNSSQLVVIWESNATKGLHERRWLPPPFEIGGKTAAFWKSLSWLHQARRSPSLAQGFRKGRICNTLHRVFSSFWVFSQPSGGSSLSPMK